MQLAQPGGSVDYCFSPNTDAAVLIASSAAGNPAYTTICKMISRMSSRVQPTFSAPNVILQLCLRKAEDGEGRDR